MRPSRTSVVTAGSDQEGSGKSSLLTRVRHQLFGLSTTTRSRQEQEVTTLARLEAIMTEEAFNGFQEERDKKTSARDSDTRFPKWYNKNKSNPDLKKILTEQKNTDAVRALKSQIVRYEAGAVERLNKYASQSNIIPPCLKLKTEELFDRHNNYLNPNPKLEVTENDAEEVLGWYLQGVSKSQLLPGRWHVEISRNLEDSNYSDSEVARKLKKCLAVREQWAVDALKELMPDEAFEVFKTLIKVPAQKPQADSGKNPLYSGNTGAKNAVNEDLSVENKQILGVESGNSLVGWYNSCADTDPRFLKHWHDYFFKTEAQDAYHAFMVRYNNHASQKFKAFMGDEVYNSCFTQLPCMISRDAMARNWTPLPGYMSRESSFRDHHLEKVNSWLKSLSDEQWQQLSQGEVRHSFYMNQLKIVMSVLGYNPINSTGS